VVPIKLGLIAAASVTALMGVACGGGGTSSAPPTGTASPSPSASTLSPTPKPSPTCMPNGAELAIIAELDPASTAFSPYQFDTDCLAAPADVAFTIRFDNRDAETHNIDILDHPGGTSLFTGKLVKGPKIFTYHVDPLPQGTYYFRCDIHPLRMHGAFLVGG